uniref:Uncharacterized protein n=1 Tax=Arundo donax TaxID=35708 RepID=A0A0A8YLI4_ARUDO
MKLSGWKLQQDQFAILMEKKKYMSSHR